MKKYWVIISLALIMTLVTACSIPEQTKYNYVFDGESEHWSAEYKVTGTEVWGSDNGQRTYDHEDSRQFRLTYRGAITELAELKSLDYSFDRDGVRGGSGHQTFDQPPTELTIAGSQTMSNGAKINEDVLITVTVRWDDSEEVFTIKRNNK